MRSKYQIPDKILIVFVIMAMVLLTLAAVQFHFIRTTNVDFYEAFIELVQIIIVGFLVGAIALIIPQLLPYKRFDLDMRKEAREKYSQAKTEIDHLPYTLQFITSAQEALKLIKDIHIKKHLAETYSEYLPTQSQGKNHSPEKIWNPALIPYSTLDACRKSIREHIQEWGKMPFSRRFDLLEKAIKKEKNKGIVLPKELDLIDTTISRLNTQIRISKNICFTLWAAWVGWFTKFILDNPNSDKEWVLFGAAIFPILFWAIDYERRKSLLSTSLRQKRISIFMNSQLGRSWLEDTSKAAFPILDPIGWLYDESAYFEVFEKIKKEEGYNSNFLKKEWEDIVKGQFLRPIRVLLYKEAKWFYPALISIPIILVIYFNW